MRSTPIHALLQECGEVPLSLRRRKLQLLYAIKLQTSRNNLAKSIIANSWETHYRRFKAGAEPISTIVSEYLGIVKGLIEEQMISDTQPWHFHHTNTDMELRKLISRPKKDNPEIIKCYALELMDKYKDNFKIFRPTDGSTTENGQVGSTYYIPEIKM